MDGRKGRVKEREVREKDILFSYIKTASVHRIQRETERKGEKEEGVAEHAEETKVIGAGSQAEQKREGGSVRECGEQNTLCT